MRFHKALPRSLLQAIPIARYKTFTPKSKPNKTREREIEENFLARSTIKRQNKNNLLNSFSICFIALASRLSLAPGLKRFIEI